MLDTLSLVRRLSAAGVAEDQAEAHVQVLAEAVEQQHGETATKDFVRAEISTVRTEMKAQETRLVRWIIGAGFVYTGLLLAAIRFLFSP